MRLFVGVPVPALPGFEALQRALGGRERAARPVRLDQTHVTLKFVGEVDAARAVAVAGALKTALGPFAAHEGSARGAGAFPSERSARVVWAGLEGTRLPEMAQAVETALTPLGFAPERRGFKAHVTLARLDPPHDVTKALEPYRERLFGAVPVREVVLFESRLSPQGPEYSRRDVWTLGGGPAGVA